MPGDARAGAPDQPRFLCWLSGQGGHRHAGAGPAPHRRALSPANFPNLLVGLEGGDDAAVYRIGEDLAVVQTLDFFPPVVDDPYVFGAVAAANAMSDIYAMGGEVLLALNIAGFPEDQPPEVLAEISGAVPTRWPRRAGSSLAVTPCTTRSRSTASV